LSDFVLFIKQAVSGTSKAERAWFPRLAGESEGLCESERARWASERALKLLVYSSLNLLF